MSVAAVLWACLLPMSEPPEKAVLTALAEHAGQEKPWEADPTVARLCLYTGWNQRTVQRALKSLAEKSAIYAHPVSGGRTTYVINDDWKGDPLELLNPEVQAYVHGLDRRRRRRLEGINPGRASPPAGRHPRHPVTPDEESPPTESPDTPDTLSPTPDTLSPEPSRTGANHHLQNPRSGMDSLPREPPAEDGVPCFIRAPSDNRRGGQRTPGDVLAGLLPSVGPAEKRLKRQDHADRDMAAWLTSEGGMDTGQAWNLLLLARDPDADGHVDAARQLERISREHRIGWFHEEAAT